MAGAYARGGDRPYARAQDAAPTSSAADLGGPTRSRDAFVARAVPRSRRTALTPLAAARTGAPKVAVHATSSRGPAPEGERSASDPAGRDRQAVRQLAHPVRARKLEGFLDV